MKINVEGGTLPPSYAPRVGNVYPARGGRAGNRNHLYVVLAITEPSGMFGPTCLCLTVTREGNPVGVTQYGAHYLENLEPVAFVDGLEDLDLTMRPL